MNRTFRCGLPRFLASAKVPILLISLLLVFPGLALATPPSAGAGGNPTSCSRQTAFMTACGPSMRTLLRGGLGALASVPLPRMSRFAMVGPPRLSMQSTVGDGGGKRERIKTPGQGAEVYKAKQSLGQNFLVDQNVARRIVDSLECRSDGGKAVVEVGPGKGALTAHLLNLYPEMTAIEIDERSILYLNEQLPTLKNIMHESVLDVDWKELASKSGEPLSVIGNLPYYITSQILFSVVDAAPNVRRAIVTMQLEVAQRVCAKPGSKVYGILSVACQLYGKPRLLFKIPPTVFQPQPDVDSALVCVDFPAERPTFGINECHLRTVVRMAFNQRRKMLRQSLKALLQEREVKLPDELGTRRPEALSPMEFVELTRSLYGDGETPPGIDVWRGALGDPSRG